MAEKPIRWDNWDGGLQLRGPRDRTPEGRARRLRGVERRRRGAVRSRAGSRLVANLTAHSIHVWRGQPYFGVGTGLYRGVTALAGSSVFDGSRLSFASAPPTAGTKPYLFIAGGAYPAKLDEHDALTRWGIEAPVDGAVAALLPEVIRTIHAMDSTASVVPYTSGAGPLEEIRLLSAGVNPTVTAGIYAHQNGQDRNIPTGPIEGADALLVANDPEGDKWIARYYPGTFAIDLTTYADGTESALEDYISFYIWILKETQLKEIELKFSTSTGGFEGAGYVVKLQPVAANSAPESIGEQVVGLGDLTPEELTALQNEDGANRSFTPTSFLAPDMSWVRLFIPKALFSRYGRAADATAPATAGDWSTVTGWQFYFSRSPNRYDHVVLDHLHLTGPHGLQGDYEWRYRYESSITGSPSNLNPGEAKTELEGVKRRGAQITAIPRSTDAQVDRIAIYRTVGGGSEFFRAGTVPNPASGTASFTDTVADYSGLDSADDTQILDIETAETDNLPPEDTFEEVAGPHRGRLYVARNTASGAQGRLGYSASDRAEAFPSFLNLGPGSELVTHPVIWQGRVWVFLESGIWVVDDNDVPTGNFVTGPGTIWPNTVAVAPGGILYAALDGIRVFDGSSSRLLAADSIAPLFVALDALEGRAPFVPTVAAYHDGEYWISDGVHSTFAVDLETEGGPVRELGLPFSAAFAEIGQRRLLVAAAAGVLSAEDKSEATDAGSGIPFELDTGDVRIATDRRGIIRAFWIDAETGSTLVTATAILDGTELVLPPFSHTGRSPMRLGIGREASTVGLRLAAVVTGEPIEVFSVEAEIYIPE